MYRLALFLVLAPLAPLALRAQQNVAQAPIRTVPVAPGLHMIVGAGGNLGVSSGEDGTFVVDDQYAPIAPRLLEAIRAISPRPLRFVLNTHWHGDHTGGNEAFGGAGALIVAHENVRRRMSTRQFIVGLGDTVPPSPKAALPVVTFSDTVSFYINGETLRVVHVRDAHTDGDAIVWWTGANVVHMGDTFFNGMYPFIDIGTGGSLAGTIAAVDRVLALTNDATRFIPGHGPLATRAELRAYRDMLATVHGRLARLVRAGRTREQVLAAGVTRDLDAAWGKGFLPAARWVPLMEESVRRELRGPRGRR